MDAHLGIQRDDHGPALQGYDLTVVARWRWAPQHVVERLNIRLRALAQVDVRACRRLIRRQSFRALRITRTHITFHRPAPDLPRCHEALLLDMHDPDHPQVIASEHHSPLDAVVQQATILRLALPNQQRGGVQRVSVWATSGGWWGASEDSGELIGPLDNRQAVIQQLMNGTVAGGSGDAVGR